MNTGGHLDHLLEERRSLLREVARLDVAIAAEQARARGTVLAAQADAHRHGSLSWEQALHEAKIPPGHGIVVMHG